MATKKAPKKVLKKAPKKENLFYVDVVKLNRAKILARESKTTVRKAYESLGGKLQEGYGLEPV